MLSALSDLFGMGDGEAMVLTPKDWGPHYWFVFYTTAIAAPEKPSEDEQKAFVGFAESFQFILPCSICKNHYKEILKTHPPSQAAPKGREGWIEWVLLAHNSVRARQQKTQVTHQDVRHILGGMVHRQQDYDRVWWFAVALSLVLGGFLAYNFIVKKKRVVLQ